MAEPFKHLIDAALVRDMAKHLLRVSPDFPRSRFVQLAMRGLDQLELKARVQHVATALAATLPDDFAAAADVLEQSLAPARLDDDLSALRTGPHGLAGWAVWPMTEFVAQRGLGAPERSLRALHAMTQRNTAEYAIRPFLVAHEALTFAVLRRWLDDPSPHVRRLVSEGSRPRLPWGMQLKRLVADPSPTLPLLEALQDDPSAYVQRSVANHLNDIAKDHPHVVAHWLERHLPEAPAPRLALLRHASRTLVKCGDRRVLTAWGVGQGLRGEATLRIVPQRARIGGQVTLVATLTSSAGKSQRLVVDYIVRREPAGRSASRKTWKGWKLELAAAAHRELQKVHSLRPVTTRRLQPGRHDVDLVVNGRVAASAHFELRG